MQDELKRLGLLYASMDKAYASVAASYNFSCEGCDENCCTQRFFHYTFAEYMYLMEGVKKLPSETRDLIFRRATVVVESYPHELQAGEMFKLMCPVNFEGLCGLYEWRPMICRLHGLPHFFRMPDGTERAGGGCHRIEAGEKKLDRTPFYTELAAIEKSLRENTGFRERIKKTTAQMLLDMSFELEFED